MTHFLSIVIVNYRSGDLVLDCLRSLYRYNETGFEVLVVDNASGDESREKITTAFPQVRWIQMDTNAGFSRGNNAGLRAAIGDTYLLLNPDTVCFDDSVTQCFNRLNASTFVAASVQLFDREMQPQISGSYFVKGGLNHLLPLPYLGAFIRFIGYRVKTKVPNVQRAKKEEDVDWISGAFLMVKKEGVEKAGLLDEDFFLYAEEVEWCSRLKKFGSLVLFGDLRIIHLEGATINKSQNLDEKGYYNLYDRKGLQLMVSNHLRVRKQYGAFWFFVLLCGYSFGVFVFFFAGFFHRLFTLQNPFAHFAKAGLFAANVFQLWRLAPTIVGNRPHFYKML